MTVLGKPTSQAGGTPDPAPMSLEHRAALTVASSSNLPKSSLSSFTSSWAVHWEAKPVKPTMSANRMLQEGGGHCTRRTPAPAAALKPRPRHSSTQAANQGSALPILPAARSQTPRAHGGRRRCRHPQPLLTPPQGTGGAAPRPLDPLPGGPMTVVASGTSAGVTCF